MSEDFEREYIEKNYDVPKLREAMIRSLQEGEARVATGEGIAINSAEELKAFFTEMRLKAKATIQSERRNSYDLAS